MEQAEYQTQPGYVAARTHIQFVTNLLKAHGHPMPAAWEAHLVNEAHVTTDSALQRFLINSTWRHILATVTTESTLNVRYSLLDKGSVNDWERLFKDAVIPFIAKHKLPVVNAA